MMLARRNPIPDWLAESLVGLAGSIAITVGVIWYEKRAVAQANAAPTTASATTLSLSNQNGNQNAVTFQLPQGGTLVSSSSASSAIATVSGLTATAVAAGSTTVTLHWNDSTGAAQTTLCPVTVTA